MKRMVAVVLVVVLSSTTAFADDRDLWRGAFAGSLTLTLGGVMFAWHGWNKVQEAEDELCDRGAYPDDPSCPRPATPITREELDRLNDKGERGSTFATVGVGMVAVGAVLSGITFYKGFVAKPRERAVAITPTVSKDGAGAALTLRW
jgi:hypothetical protein